MAKTDFASLMFSRDGTPAKVLICINSAIHKGNKKSHLPEFQGVAFEIAQINYAIAILVILLFAAASPFVKVAGKSEKATPVLAAPKIEEIISL